MNPFLNDPSLKENDLMCMSISDNTGRILFHNEISLSILNEVVNTFASSLSVGTYQIKITHPVKGNLLREQILKM
jgi:hypothetical protein